MYILWYTKHMTDTPTTPTRTPTVPKHNLNGLALVNNNTKPNPVAVKRARLGISQDELAEWTGTSKGFVQRVERGTVTRLSWSFMHSICSDNDDITVLEANYAVWQEHVRKCNMLYVRNILAHSMTNPGYWWNGSWLTLRMAISTSKAGFCKLYCIHPGVIDNFEKKDRRKLTPYLLEVLQSGGLEPRYIRYLEERMSSAVTENTD